jgi:hypothetical protein
VFYNFSAECLSFYAGVWFTDFLFLSTLFVYISDLHYVPRRARISLHNTVFTSIKNITEELDDVDF